MGTVEARYAEARDAFEDLLVARTRGAATDPSVTIERLETDYRNARRAVSESLASLADGASGQDRAVVASIVRALADLDEVEASDGAEAPDAADALTGSAAAASLRQETMRRYGQAAAALPWRGETLDRLTIFGRLAASQDPDEQRSLFEALEPCWRAVDGDGGEASPYRRLIQSGATRWRLRSPIEANAAALGIDPDGVEALFRRILRTWRDAVHPDGHLIEPWRHRALGGEAGRRFGASSVEWIRSINDTHLRSIGADPGDLGVTYDIEPRLGRPPVSVAFTVARRLPAHDIDGWRRADSWVFAEYRTGGIGELAELLHETGHAVQVAAIRTRPALAGDHDPDLAAWWEAWADVVGWDVDEPAFQARHLGDQVSLAESRRARYAPGTVLEAAWSLFEIELHLHPDRRPNDVWAEIAERELCLVGHPEWSWWAVRGQLIDSPGYLANYVLGAVVTAAVRARLAELRGPWWERADPGWYAFVSAALLRWGAERPPADVLRDFLGGPVTVDPLLQDIALAGS